MACIFNLFADRSHLTSPSPTSIRKRIDSVSSQTSFRKLVAKDYPGMHIVITPPVPLLPVQGPPLYPYPLALPFVSDIRLPRLGPVKICVAIWVRMTLSAK